MVKQYAPATQRNRDAIASVLAQCLPEQGSVLEIASGTGQHVLHFAACFPHIVWQPSDPDADALASIAAWRAEAGLDNLAAPIQLDASDAAWPIQSAAAIVCVNMVHIAPWAATQGLMAGAARILPRDGVLYLYGPYREADVVTAQSNEVFDASLKQRNANWGLRDKEDVLALAAFHGLGLVQRVAMPANNLSLIFRKNA